MFVSVLRYRADDVAAIGILTADATDTKDATASGNATKSGARAKDGGATAPLSILSQGGAAKIRAATGGKKRSAARAD